jgi:hexulose-6-phosphate isomerase
MKRRDFIKNSLLAAGALTLPLDEMFASPELETKALATTFRKSIMWGTIDMEGSILTKTKAIKTAGYEGVEPSSHLDRQEMIDALKATGLVASGVCCSSHWNKQLSAPDANTRKEAIEGVTIALEDAKAYGTDAVLVVPGTVSDTFSYDDCWNYSTESIKKLIPVAKKLNVKICIENVWNNFLLSPMEACRYVDQFNSSHVGFYFDCGNILVYGWPEQWIKILGRRIFRIHIKEFSRQKADKEGRWAGFNVKLTEGDVNWKNVVAQAQKTYQGQWFTTEQGSSRSVEDLTDLCRRLSSIIA